MDLSDREDVVDNLTFPRGLAIQLECGNRLVDPDESCDVAIQSGQPGACPTACSDGNPCTLDVLAGDGTCTAACVFPLAPPTDGDGCCPPGGNANNDNDCTPVCGNGACEAGENTDNCPRDCSGGVPTASAWGMTVMTLLLLVGGRVLFGRYPYSSKFRT